MKRAYPKHSAERSPEALERLKELAQTLPPMEWERRLRTLERAIRTRQNIKRIPDDASLALTPFSHPPLRAENTAQSWTRYQFPGQNQSVQIQFRIPPQLLRPRRTAPFATRAALEQTDTLVLNDTIAHANEHISVQAWLTQMPQNNRYTLRLGIQGDSLLLKHSQVELEWGAQHFSKPLRRNTLFQTSHPDFSQELALTFKLAPHDVSRSHPPSRSTTRATKRTLKTRAKKV